MRQVRSHLQGSASSCVGTDWKHDLFVKNVRGVREYGAESLRRERGIVCENLLLSPALGKELENEIHRKSRRSDDGLAA